MRFMSRVIRQGSLAGLLRLLTLDTHARGSTWHVDLYPPFQLLAWFQSRECLPETTLSNRPTRSSLIGLKSMAYDLQDGDPKMCSSLQTPYSVIARSSNPIETIVPFPCSYILFHPLSLNRVPPYLRGNQAS